MLDVLLKQMGFKPEEIKSNIQSAVDMMKNINDRLTALETKIDQLLKRNE